MSRDALVETAALFWERAGPPPPFPRDLEPVIPRVVQAWVIGVTGLTPGAARAWLARRRLDLPLTVSERRLHGCLLAYRDRAVLFVENELPADWRRVVVAHELAHYLADYLKPRDRARRRLGEAVVPLLDGARPAEAPEAWAAALAGVPLDAHVHYLERTYDPRQTPVTRRVERAADALACELLAPRHDVRQAAQALGLTVAEPAAWQRLLVERFGLPAVWAAAYADRLLADARKRRSFSERFGL